MHLVKNLIKLPNCCSCIASIFASTNVKSAEECFEGTSRAIFKFNMVLDDIVLEPLAKGYNKLPSPIRTGSKKFYIKYRNIVVYSKQCFTRKLQPTGSFNREFYG